jgi:hypothetical protein
MKFGCTSVEIHIFLDVFVVILHICLISVFNYYTYITVTKLVTSIDMTVHTEECIKQIL